MYETLIQAFVMLGQGMLGIFVVLGVIALLVILMQRLDRKSETYKAKLHYSQSATTSASPAGPT